MKFDFRRVTKSDSEDFLTWKYDGIYSFYNNDIVEAKAEWIRSLPEQDNAFSIYNEKNELIGNCEFYQMDQQRCLGVQMRPSLTGQGMGTEFVESILQFGKEKYELKDIELAVAKFNKRAIRVYEKLGFEKTEEFTSQANGMENEFVVMKLYY